MSKQIWQLSDAAGRLLMIGLAALAARGETGPTSADTCRALAVNLGEEKAFDMALKVRTDEGVQSTGNPPPLKQLSAKDFEAYAKEFMEEAKRRNIPPPRRSFSFND
jgi:hypothetical protein